MTRFLAWRFMLKSTEKGTFSAMTFFSWLAIGVGVGAMGSLLSVMYGFEGALKEKVLNAYPHILVEQKNQSYQIKNDLGLLNQIKNTEGVERVLPYVQNEMILRSDRKSVGSVIWGVSPTDFNSLRFALREGNWPASETVLPQAMMGSELANRLGLIPGDRITLISPLKREGALGFMPQSQTFEVVGTFSSGHYEFDEQYVVLDLQDAQDLLGWEDQITGWQIWVKDLDKTASVVKRIQEILPGDLQAKSWETFNSALFQSLKLEQYSMFIILSFAILIAVMNIIITLTMNVVHKKKNIGILRAIGASPRQIRSVFLWQGLLTGSVGLVIGVVFTTLFVVYVRYFSQFQLPEIYYDRTLPIELRPLSLFLVYSVASLFIYLATLAPSAQAARLPIIESIRE